MYLICKRVLEMLQSARWLCRNVVVETMHAFCPMLKFILTRFSLTRLNYFLPFIK